MSLQRLLVIFLLFVLSWITYLDRAAISSAKEGIAADLSLSDQQIGLVFSSFALGYALAQVPSGWLADRIGPRLLLTVVVAGWSLLTAVTGLAGSLITLVLVRFIFGVAEAGAYPGSARVIYNWLPVGQHGRANGILFSGSRLGAAMAFPLLAWLMADFGWRNAFLLLAVPGIAWALVWLAWFRDVPPGEAVVHAAREEAPLGEIFRSGPMLLAMIQYFCSNFTNFLSLSWINPYLIQQFKLGRDTAAWYTMVILLIGATSQWVSGFLTDRLYRSAWQKHSRQIPAITGFVIAAVGLLITRAADDAPSAVAGFCLAAFGAELTISPSWAFCIDLGGKKSGAVSGSMNMIGNLGSFTSANVFPWLHGLTGSAGAYFLTAAVLNLVAAGVWTRMSRRT
ncbi:MAG: MFS transporter [Bryobacteraceae bacterium]|nr:MFS transporter [Bryobacteraceae bacterium]